MVQCKPIEAPAQTPTQVAPSTSPPPTAPSQSTPVNNTPSAKQKSYEEISVPERVLSADVAPMAPEVQPISQNTSYTKLSGAEYLANFNKYSTYAVAGAQDEASSVTPIEPTSEGWRIFGVAWYWWGMGILAITVIVASVSRKFLRKSPVLSGRQ